MLKISKCNNINFFVNAGGKFMQNCLILSLIFRNRVQEYVYNFDIVAVDEKLNSSLVGGTIVNTTTGNVFVTITTSYNFVKISGKVYVGDRLEDLKSALMDESLQMAKRIEEEIFC